MTDQNPSPQSVVVPDPLWMMHVIGPDDIYPAPDHATAVQWCAYLNSEIAPKVPSVLCVAVPAIWTGTAEEHAEGLAEAIKGWTVPAAPAPSSLAGGDRKQFLCDVLCGVALDGNEPIGETADRILAALSPEAPARDGGVSLDALADWLVMRERQSTDGAQQHIEKAPAKHFCAGKASAFREVASVLWNSPEWFAALTPRHEAPASEGGA